MVIWEWFKAYVVNASDNRRAESKVLYVDLLSPGGVVLKQQKLQIVAGQCDGSFPLLDGTTSPARQKEVACSQTLTSVARHRQTP